MISKKSYVIGGVICTLLGTAIAPSVKPENNYAIAQSRVSSQENKPKTPLPNPRTTPTPLKSDIQIISVGAQPLQTLRFTPKANSKESADMQMTMNMAMSVNGNPAPAFQIPGTKMKLNTVVSKVEPNGDFHYDFSYSDVGLVGNSTLPPAVLANMRNEMKKIEAFKGSAIVDNMGRTKKANFVVPPNSDPSLKQMMEQMAASIEQVSAQVPEQAIGKGAKWQVKSQISLNGINLQQTANYELVDIKNGIATMNINLTQTIPGTQNMVLPQMPPGMTMTLQSYSATGSGQAKVSLNRIMPLSTNLAMNTKAQMSTTIPNSQEKMLMDQQISMEMKIESQP